MQELTFADSTLYLSHPYLHELCKSEKNFEATEKLMVAMKNAIKVLHNDSTPKLNELKSSLPALKYHGNYRKFIPIVLQVVRGIRTHDQAKTASEIMVCLLTQPDSQFRSETHFQLHSLVQDILGVGQALDVNGTRKHDLSFLILDGGIIFKTLIQACLNLEVERVKERRQL